MRALLSARLNVGMNTHLYTPGARAVSTEQIVWWWGHLVRAVLQSTFFVRHSERSEESLFVLNGRDTEGFLASLGMTDALFPPNQMTPIPIVWCCPNLKKGQVSEVGASAPTKSFGEMGF